jgi:hypothetical protein
MIFRDGQIVPSRADCRHSVPRGCGRGLWLLFVLLLVRSVNAQNPTSSDLAARSDQSAPNSQPGGQVTLRTVSGELSGVWTPLGPAPVDQAGAGRRGYVLVVEDSDVTAAGATQFSIHAVAANNFYREETTDFLVSQRYETHTIALDYRRGFKARNFPRFEIGGQVQLHESDNGMLNGFIQGIESFWVSLSGYQASKNLLRAEGAARPPQGTLITRNGSPIYREEGNSSGIGDVHLTAKAALLDGDPSSKAARISARIGINIAGSSPFTEGNFVGAGVSIEKKVHQAVAFHGDIRVARALDRASVWNLPLKGAAYGFSVGPEFKLPKHSSLSLQVDGSSTPYLPTGTVAFDQGYGDLAVALGHQYRTGSRRVTAQLYMRENMNLPFRVRWNTDPDMSVGLKVRIH